MKYEAHWISRGLYLRGSTTPGARGGGLGTVSPTAVRSRKRAEVLWNEKKLHIKAKSGIVDFGTALIALVSTVGFHVQDKTGRRYVRAIYALGILGNIH